MKIIHGDCLEELKEIPDNSIDSIVTDPPYGLSFMGKKWDYDVPSEEIWKECLRVLKPGGHLLSFAGSRTYHRMAVRIEDAGFEIRDMIAWVYASGFPKSLDVSKAVDKLNGREFEDRYELGRHIKERREAAGLSRKQVNERFNSVAICNHWEAQDRNNAIPPTPEHWRILKEWLGCDSKYDALIDRVGADRQIVGQYKSLSPSDVWRINGGFGGESVDQSTRNITAPATEAAKQWEGWGTALKPAHEPIVVARKPLIGTVAENVLTHGTGGLNIDGSRVGTETITQRLATVEGGKAIGAKAVGIKQKATGETTTTIGRWPANLIHDGSEEVLECFPNTKTGSLNYTNKGGSFNAFAKQYERKVEHQGDSGSAARFFKECKYTNEELEVSHLIYQAKASKKDRDEGLEGFEEKEGVNGNKWTDQDYRRGDEKPTTKRQNTHPTVKPTALMRYLVKLVTPPGGTVLDPFTGSGSTGKACKLEGFEFIGIEREEEYVKIAEARIAAVIHQPTLV